MTDQQIVELYWNRDERAIHETDLKYRKYLYKIAYNILANEEDCEESINETYLRTWNSIPTNQPQILFTYVGKIIRELSIDIYRTHHRKKRQGSEYAVSLEELKECTLGMNATEEGVDCKLLAETIHSFLMSLPKEHRVVFIGRYYYLDSMKYIAEYTGFSKAKVKIILHTTRNKLKDYLCEEGYSI